MTISPRAARCIRFFGVMGRATGIAIFRTASCALLCGLLLLSTRSLFWLFGVSYPIELFCFVAGALANEFMNNSSKSGEAA